MARTFKILSLSIGLTAFAILAIFGFAIWVVIPLFPAGVAFVIALGVARRRATAGRIAEEETDSRKAA